MTEEGLLRLRVTVPGTLWIAPTSAEDLLCSTSALYAAGQELLTASVTVLATLKTVLVTVVEMLW